MPKNEKPEHGGCLIAVSNNVSFTEVDIRHLSEAIQESLVFNKLNQRDPELIAIFITHQQEATLELNKTILKLFLPSISFR